MSEKSKPILAVIQYKPPKGQTQIARQELLPMIEEACQNADIVVCPEMAFSGYVFESAAEILPHTETQNGATFQALSQLASQYKSWIVCGFAEEAEDGLLYNAAWVVASDGRLAGCYRKILLYDEDFRWSESGWERMIFDTEFGTLAPAICMDLNDNNLIYWLWQSQPDIIAFCSNWLNQDSSIDDYWKMRLWGWRGWFIGANRWGEDCGIPFRGESAILSPTGHTVVKAGIEGDCILYWDTQKNC